MAKIEQIETGPLKEKRAGVNKKLKQIRNKFLRRWPVDSDSLPRTNRYNGYQM